MRFYEIPLDSRIRGSYTLGNHRNKTEEAPLTISFDPSSPFDPSDPDTFPSDSDLQRRKEFSLDRIWTTVEDSKGHSARFRFAKGTGGSFPVFKPYMAMLQTIKERLPLVYPNNLAVQSDFFSMGVNVRFRQIKNPSPEFAAAVELYNYEMELDRRRSDIERQERIIHKIDFDLSSGSRNDMDQRIREAEQKAMLLETPEARQEAIRVINTYRWKT